MKYREKKVSQFYFAYMVNLEHIEYYSALYQTRPHPITTLGAPIGHLIAKEHSANILTLYHGRPYREDRNESHFLETSGKITPYMQCSLIVF